jgi:hypothetical protein
MSFLPLVGCGMYLLYGEETDHPRYARGKIPLVLGLTGIISSHILTTEMVVGLVLLFALVMAKRTFRRKTFLQLFQAAGLTLLLSAFFWVPFLIMFGADRYKFQDLVNLSIQERGAYFAAIFQLYPNKGYAQTGMYQAEPLYLGVGILLLLLFFIVLIYRKIRRREGRNPYEKTVLVLATGTAAVFLLSTRYFPWDTLAKIPGVSVLVTALQFPTRFLSPATMLCAFFAAFFVLWLKVEWGRIKLTKGILLCVGILAIGSGVYQVNEIAYILPPVRLYSMENYGSHSIGAGEYLLGNMAWYEAEAAYTYHLPLTERDLTYDQYHKNGLNIAMKVRNEASQTRYLEVPVIGYEGYVIKSKPDQQSLIGGDRPFITAQRGTHEDLRIAIPANWSGELTIGYEGNILFRIAEILSLATLLGLLYVVWKL